jgi:hypothetical protein
LQLRCNIDNKASAPSLYKTPERILKKIEYKRACSIMGTDNSMGYSTNLDRSKTPKKTKKKTSKPVYDKSQMTQFMERTEGYMKRKDTGIEGLKTELAKKVKQDSTPVKPDMDKYDDILLSSKRYTGMNFRQRQEYYKKQKDGFLQEYEERKVKQAELERAVYGGGGGGRGGPGEYEEGGGGGREGWGEYHEIMEQAAGGRGGENFYVERRGDFQVMNLNFEDKKVTRYGSNTNIVIGDPGSQGSQHYGGTKNTNRSGNRRPSDRDSSRSVGGGNGRYKKVTLKFLGMLAPRSA